MKKGTLGVKWQVDGEYYGFYFEIPNYVPPGAEFIHKPPNPVDPLGMVNTNNPKHLKLNGYDTAPQFKLIEQTPKLDSLSHEELRALFCVDTSPG